MPFFEQTWGYLAAFAVLRNEFEESDLFLHRAERVLQDYDFEPTRYFYEDVKKGDYSSTMSLLHEHLAKWSSRFPVGYQQVKLAVLDALSAMSLEDGLNTLSEVSIKPNDHQWLNDIVTIHRAWAYSRFGDLEGEAAELEQLLSKQKMLFEPDLAYHFALLPYQETLKSWYQTGSQ